ncbi:SO_0444 family Cu/Zn efflux transporter [Tichowtungia aerotolerans]|uniref:SO_0444 family Cu/Zn efflux transporter n=1 Tax=Tichowtungia aerotolerans TaxID=2697043 RepID=A0A6P1MBR2_9BACT|nr:SO_0444 family Cu/Zn efflux transporter [Tichowtungia aerotolerans]QHI69006.1 SO_0444 family Cu/Zn efflux transporter [Tichowtungia aerotolerans]
MAIMAPYLLLGFLVAGILAAFVPVTFIETHLGKRGFKQIIKASLLGVPIPLCSCSVIPLSASLSKHGATRGATVSFLTSTPQTGVDSIAATWGLLGPLFAVFRTVVAFITGCICGASVEAFSSAQDESPHEACDEHCPSCNPVPKTVRWKQVFTYGFGTLPRDIGRALLIGILVSGLLGALVPEDLFTRYLNSEWLSMLAVMGLGIPLYVCSTGSIPIALAMIGAGLSPGAGLVFLITGPATNAATITTVFKSMGKKAVIIYLTTLAGCSLIAGWLLNRILSIDMVVDHVEHHATSAGIFEHICAAFLTALLIRSVLPRKKKCCSEPQH